MTLRYVTLVFMDRGVEVHKFSYKEQGQYPAFFTEQARLIKDLLLTWPSGKFILRDIACNAEQERWRYQSNRGHRRAISTNYKTLDFTK